MMTPFQIEMIRQREKYDLALADAERLPWDDFRDGMAYALGCFGVMLGLLLNFWGAFIGWPIGYLFGWALALAARIPIYIWPEPFAWLARRLDYV
ncbi:MAG: hypothetical protein LBE33_03890 [Zoogloeaceae bacterium]|jgi:hypothetical protein|nr:hypothetical protein [Zoogloeaceae bacterium]